eukprot:CAMPEP_0116916208 /NCGR_PEP_ID=MMETSP0467-20121206/18390_1 /TAXON_ID=283647 /ORGANISM="Mesodinium pulex, Strain SPMC105" /LENGTH=31 /DNA_ID= /DNA_START= /DNA_END= /DNA_ORIENTATION=
MNNNITKNAMMNRAAKSMPYPDSQCSPDFQS